MRAAGIHERMSSMSEFKSQLQHADPLADARAWLAHMKQTIVRLAAERALEEENERLSAPLKDHDTQPEDRLRIAELFVRELHEVRYSCELADGGGHAPELNCKD